MQDRDLPSPLSLMLRSLATDDDCWRTLRLVRFVNGIGRRMTSFLEQFIEDVVSFIERRPAAPRRQFSLKTKTLVLLEDCTETPSEVFVQSSCTNRLLVRLCFNFVLK